jgi:hypothetical protein
LDNDWYRLTATTSSSVSVYVPQFFILQDSYTTGLPITLPYLGDGTSGIYIWGAQLVEGSTAKDYLRTETRLNIPRLDYSNGTCPSILVEPQRTNVLTYSEQFDNAAWQLYSSGTGSNPIVTANTTTSPSGAVNADTIVLNAGAGTTAADQSQIYQTFTIVNGNTYTFSFYAKGAVGGEQIMIRQAAGSNYTKITITNDWARYTVTETASYSGTGFLEILIRRGLNEPINASATFYAWGAQIELGSYPTSYIPTTSAAVTRNADAIYKTGISALIGQTEGTLFVEVDKISRTDSELRLNISDGTASNWIFIGLQTNNVPILYVITGGSNVASISGSSLSSGNHKIAGAYKNNDFVLYVDGVQIGTDNSGAIGTYSRLQYGGNYIDTPAETDSRTAQIVLFPTRLTNAELASLTTL